MFNSTENFVKWLEENEKFVFISKPKRLRSWHILLQSLASGDFNPAHTRPEFSKRSFFKTVVSHGIGIIARAEGQFVGLLPKYFAVPIEIIALGFDKIIYRSPLRLGDVYQYRFEISLVRLLKTRCDLSCHVVCEVLEPNPRIVAEYNWKPAIIEHKADEESVRLLESKSYWQNVFEIFVFGQASQRFAHTLLLVALIVLCTSPALIATGILHVNPAYIQACTMGF